MSFSQFRFEDTDISDLLQNNKTAVMSDQDTAVLALLKRLLSSYTDDRLHHLAELHQRLEHDFIFWVALFNQEADPTTQLESQPTQHAFQQINEIMAQYRQSIRHELIAQRHVIEVDAVIDDQTLQDLVNQPILKTPLINELPCIFGYAPTLTITAVNCFDTRIPLHTDDLANLEHILYGSDIATMDLPHLITLEIGLPTWQWSNVVIHKKAHQSPKKISQTTLTHQLNQANRTPLPIAHTALKRLFSTTQQQAQAHIDQSKQLLSTSNKALLSDEKFYMDQEDPIALLQRSTRAKVNELQKQADDLMNFCRQTETDLTTLLAKQ